MAHHDIPDGDEALRLAQEGNYTGAIACCDRLLASSPGNVPALNNKAVVLICLGRYQESLEYSGKASAISPRDAGPWINRGIALEKLGRLPEAADALEHAITLDPFHAYPRALLGIVYQKMDMSEKAEVQNRMLQEIIFPHAYAGFYFATAAFLLGILLGGIISVEGKPLAFTAVSAIVITLFFVLICFLYVRARTFQTEVRRDVFATPFGEAGPGRWRTAGNPAALLSLIAVFGAGTLAGIGAWRFFG